MAEEYMRRATDQPDAMERITRVEDAVVGIREDLREHIIDESGVFRDIADSQREMKDAIVRLTVLQERQDKRDERAEEREEKHELRLDQLEQKMGIIWWAGPASVMVVGALWAVATHFKWF